MANEELNVDLTPEEQAQLAADGQQGDKDQTAAAAEAAKAAKEAADAAAAAAANQEAVKPDPVVAALEASTAALEASNRLQQEAAERTAAQQKAAADAKAAAEAPKEPDWNKEKADLRARHEAGELDDDQYEAQREALLEKKTEWLATARADAKVAERLQHEAEARARADGEALDRAWTRAVEAFNADPVNAEFLSNATRAHAFNATLQAVAQERPDATFDQMLLAARDRVAEAFNIRVSSQEAAAAAVKKEEERRAAEAGKPPANLNGLPAAGQFSESRFSNLDNLDVSSLEDRLALMKPEDVEQFLADAPGGLRDHPRST